MQNNQRPVKQTMKTLMKAMNDHDPDVAEMSAKDLCKHILQDAVDLKAPENRQFAAAITDDYLKQVGSLSFVVHSAAIRCLAEIVPKLAKQQLIYIFKSTISSITDPKVESKRMEVFSSSASTMINLAPADIGSQLSSLFVQCVNQFIKLSSKKNTRQEEDVLINLLHLIIDFSQKWPDVVGSNEVKYDKQLLIQILLRNIQTSTKLDLSRKSDVALQKLAAVFDRNNFEFCFDHRDFGILKHTNLCLNANDEESFKRLKNGIACINHLAHAHNREMTPWVKKIATLCVTLINKYKNNSEHIGYVSEILENSIDCLTSLLRAFSSEMTEWIGTGKFVYLSNFLEETLNFDLQGMMQYLDSGYDMDEEEQQEYYNENSVCWKVRQISLDYATMLMRKDHEFKQKKGKSAQFLDLLSTKLIQENQNVSKKAFQCFNFIIQSISTAKKQVESIEEQAPLKRVKSNEGDFALNLVDKIATKIQILFNHKKTKQQAKTQGAKTLLNLIQLLNDRIKDNEVASTKILKLIEQLLPKVKPDTCVFLIKSSKSLINGYFPFNKAQRTLDVYLKMIKNNNFKVVAASYDGIRNCLKYYHQDILKSVKINQILASLLAKLKEHDADKLVKVQAVRCLGPIFKNMFNFLPEVTQNQILQSAETKLKVQIDKATILSQIPQIPQNYVIKKSQEKQFISLLNLCSQTIGNANYQVSNLSVDCCNRLMRLQNNTLNLNTAEMILNKSRPLLSDEKIPKFLQIIIQKFPNSVKPYAESIVKTGHRQYIKKLIQYKIIAPQKCIQILKGIVNHENSKRLSLILGEIQPSKQRLLAQSTDSKWGFVNLGALGYRGDLSTIEQIQKLITKEQNHDYKFQGARSIGNIASRYPDYSNKLIELSNSNQGYLYLHALKEMLAFSNQPFPNIQKIIHFIFAKSEQSDKQTNKHLLAECIGNVSRLSPVQLQKILNSLPHMNAARKFIVASSLKYALETANSMNDERIQRYIGCIVQLSKDSDVNVREGALKSLNSIVQNRIDILRHFIDKSFVDQLFNSMTIKAELIKIIDYGVSKQKKDLGKGLRIEAFNFLKSIIQIQQIQRFYQGVVAKCLQKINEQTSNDLILKRVSIIKIVSERDITVFVPYQNEFATKLGTDGVLKPYTNVDDERSEGYLKGLFREILAIARLNSQGSEAIKAMINKIKNYEKLRKIIQSVQKGND